MIDLAYCSEQTSAMPTAPIRLTMEDLRVGFEKATEIRREIATQIELHPTVIAELQRHCCAPPNTPFPSSFTGIPLIPNCGRSIKTAKVTYADGHTEEIPTGL